ncbi:uncharacterized protein zbtb46 isoform X1 [Labrus mixtus]|uniref:uncharacterized protein zbtb46 isoform X1 n=1 Tax=Labrus mixtus TaxID=508554 RepID=UPI0029C02402|nr:uncharacterized protein zbtb46 isoform X1 [Labrus mixtus]XP_060913132.1 uncharacterized protein zbtb46 isoform X1 [Labrus mixtus]
MNNRKEDMEISSHYRQLLRELNEQRQHGILCDACVIVDGKIFKAHKNVLLGSSRYFKTLYCQVKKGSEPHHQTTVTHLDIVTATGFKAILDFMYSAHLALTSKNVIEVMSAASYLQMTDIVQACHSFIKAALDISIRSEMADELADFEMGAVAAASIGGGGGSAGGPVLAGAGGVVGAGLGGGGGIVGMASEALASIMSGRSTSPWLARRTSPANSSGDSAIASCHEGGSTYGKEDQEPPKSHESQEEACHDSQPAWPHDYRPVTVKEEQVSPASSSHPRDTPRGAAQSQGEQGAGGAAGGGVDGSWQPLSGSGRRKNRKNKDTVRHITQQSERNWDRERDRERERDSRPGSPLPSMLAVAGWNYNGQEITGADVTEPNSSDSRGERLDFFLKQEEALTTEPSYLGPNESEEAGGGAGGGTISSVANLKAALLSKNSLLSLRAEMMGDDNPLLYEYLPKGGHSLSWLRSNNCSTLRPGATGATIHNKQGAGSSPPPLPLLPPHLPPSPPPPPLLPSSSSSTSAYCPPTPPTPLHPSEPRPLEAPGLRAGATPLRSEELDMEVEEDPEGSEPSTLPEEGVKDKENMKENSTASEGNQYPIGNGQMGEESCTGGSTVPESVLMAGRRSKGLMVLGEEKRILPESSAWPSQGFPCSLCKRLFSSLQHLREHEYRHTMSLMALSLDWQSMQVPHHQPTQSLHQPQSQPLHLHQSLYRPSATEPAPARYLCSQCPASFTLKSNADRHEKTIHFKKKLMQCVYCMKHFRDRTDLHRHLSSVHSKERGHTCPACAKAFSTQKNLATHVKVCCQMGSGSGGMLGGSGGMEMYQGGGVIDSLWRLSQEMKVDNLSINVEN